MVDVFGPFRSALDDPAEHYYAITPNDSANFAVAFRGLYIGVAGNVAVVSLSGEVVTFVGVAAGSILPVRGVRVNSTLTTATSIVGMY